MKHAHGTLKRILSMSMVLALLLALLPTAAFAAEIVDSGTCGENLTWTLDSEGTLTISGTGAMPDYSTDNAELRAPWYEYSDQIVTVNMSDGITNIGANAFKGCYNLTTVNLSNDVTVIGDYAFASTHIKNLMIPEGTVEIGKYAFSAFSTFDSLSFPSTLKVVKEGAFEWTGVKNVYVPSIEDWCEIEFDSFFANPFKETREANLYVNGEVVTDVIIPYGVTRIGVSQFGGFSSMTSIQISDSVTRVEEFAFDMTPNGYGSLCKLTEIVFPASVEYIGERALGFNDNIQKIVILNSECDIACPTSMGDYFYGGMYVTWSQNSPIIYGFSGSTAESYAKLSELEFVALEKYEIISGANSTVKPEKSLTIQVDGDFTKFESVTVDGLQVDPANYTVAEGSTIVTFMAEYLSTLESREHTVTVFFTDGVASTTLTKLEYLPGDVNGDGKLNAKDATAILKYIVGKLDNAPANFELIADVNADGKVNAKDATKILKAIVGKDTIEGWK